MRVLAVGAHPDDLEVLCAGTLARMVSEGHEVTMAHASDGSRGGVTGSDSAKLREIRLAEAQASANVAGARHINLDLPDGGVSSSDPEHLKRMISVVLDTRPDLVLALHPEDYHPDHRETSKLTFNGSFAAANPMMSDAAQPYAVPAFYYMDTFAGLCFAPTEYVDITNFIEVKRTMLSQHASQLDFMHENFGSNLLDFIEVTARYRGLQASVRYAESFQLAAAWHRPRASRLLP